MPPTAFGSLPLPTVLVVILGPLAFPLGIFAPCAFWLFGSAPFGSFLSCWALWALFGALWPSLCVFVPCGFVCPALLGFFCHGWAFLALPGALWSSLGRLCPFVPFGGVFAAPFGSFCCLGPLWALPGASLPLVPCGFGCSALLGPCGLFVLPLGPFLGSLALCSALSCAVCLCFFGLCALPVCGLVAACFSVLVI